MHDELIARREAATARALALAAGYDPDETWQEFDRNAAATDTVFGGVPDDEIFPTFVRWRGFLPDARTAITAYLAQCEADGEVMAPVEPTEFMLDCALVSRAHTEDDDAETYRAMIAARPKGFTEKA